MITVPSFKKAECCCSSEVFSYTIGGLHITANEALSDGSEGDSLGGWVDKEGSRHFPCGKWQ